MKPSKAIIYSMCVTDLVCSEVMNELTDVADKTLPWVYYMPDNSGERLLNRMRQDIKEKVQWPLWSQVQEDFDT